MDLPADDKTDCPDDNNHHPSAMSHQAPSDLIHTKAVFSDTGQNGSLIREEEMAVQSDVPAEAQDGRMQQLLDDLSDGLEKSVNESNISSKCSQSDSPYLQSEKESENRSTSLQSTESAGIISAENDLGDDLLCNSSSTEPRASELEDGSSSQSHSQANEEMCSTLPELSKNLQNVSELSQDSHTEVNVHVTPDKSDTLAESVDLEEKDKENESDTRPKDIISNRGEVEHNNEGEILTPNVSSTPGENGDQEISENSKRTVLNTESREDHQNVDLINDSVPSNDKTQENLAQDSQPSEKQTDDDDDIILLSETPRDKNKKVSLATIFKCQRCGHSSNSRPELNKHLLDAHKLIIVSKQKSVDCLFCSEKLDMKDFHQHLKSEHKVLLVKSQNQTNSSEAMTEVTASSSSSTSTTKTNSTPSNQLIDLTSDEEDANKSTTPASVKADTAKKTPIETSKKSITPAKVKAKKPAEPVLPLRRTSRQIKVRSYAEEEASLSSDDNEDLDTFVDNAEDEDYQPNHVNDGKSKLRSPSNDSLKQSSAAKGKTVQDVSKSTGSSAKLIGLPTGTSPVITLNSNKSTYKTSVGVAGLPSTPKTISLAPTNQSTTTSVNAVQVIQPAPTTTAPFQNLKANQLVQFNGQLYNVVENGNVKYLVPASQQSVMVGINSAPSTATVLSNSSSGPPAPKSANVSASGNMIVKTGSGQIISIPHSLMQTSASQQSLIIPGQQQGQAFLVTLPQGQVATNIQAVKPQGAVVQTTVTNAQVTSTPSSSKSLIAATSGKQVVTPPSSSTAYTPPSSSAAYTPTHVKLAVQQTSTQVKIAAPKEVSTSSLHKTGGIFALEVCLDTATHTGTEPKKEPKKVIVIQEKETIFVVPPEERKEDPEEADKHALDSETCKQTVATAIARGHVTPNDLSMLSDKVLFECTRCNASYPQYLQLRLHVKNCSRLAPSNTPELKVHSPLCVLDEFFKAPTGASILYVYCYFCRARIMKTSHDHSVRLAHFVKHFEPQIEIAILPGNATRDNPNACSAKALEWVDYIVPPFTLDNPPTSAKCGVLDQFVSSQWQTTSHKKKKKKKKKKHKHKYRDSDSDDDDDLAGSRLSSLRPKSARYYGTLRPKETLKQGASLGGGVSNNASNVNLRGNRQRGGCSIMQSFKHIRSPNKLGSTLTASIPMKAKYRDKSRQGESTRRWNNGKTRSQMRVYGRKPSGRFASFRDHNPSPEPREDRDVIELSSDEDDSTAAKEDNADNPSINAPQQGQVSSSFAQNELSAQEATDAQAGQYLVTEDDISDYLKLIDEADELQTGPKTPVSVSSGKEENREVTSDLVDYYGNDVESTLACEPLIMEPEQVVCYFKSCPHNRMKCQLRDCEVEVTKNIRAMLGHIRVHFQILVPLQLLEKCNTQVPRQSIPRPLRLTYSQVEAHFTIAAMQEANLHLGEVQQVYTCLWRSCTRSRCYKKTICAHLIKHIFFTLISKEEYQSMARTMSAYSPSEEDTTVKRLKIVAMSKSGKKVAIVVTIPTSQTKTPQALKEAIKKSLAGDKSLKLPASVLSSIASKFATAELASSAQSKKSSATSTSSPSFVQLDQDQAKLTVLTQAEIDNLRDKFPSLLTKWNIADISQPSEKSTHGQDEKNDEISNLMPANEGTTLTESNTQHIHPQEGRKLERGKKVSMPKWKSLIERRVPLWVTSTKHNTKHMQIIQKMVRNGDRIPGAKRRTNQEGSASKQPPKKKIKQQDHTLVNEQKTLTIGPDGKEMGTASISDVTDSSGMDKASNMSSTTPNDMTDDAASSKLGASNKSSGESNVPDVSPPDQSPMINDDNEESTCATTNSQEQSVRSVDSSGVSATDEVNPVQSIEDAKSADQECNKPESSIQAEAKSDKVRKSISAKTKVVFGLSSKKIAKIFRFQKVQKSERVHVDGRGYGLGVFRCRMANCCFFQEIMSKDKKTDIVRALVMHFHDAHLRRSRHRGCIHYPKPRKDASLRSSEFLKLFKDLSPTQDFKKLKVCGKFQRLSAYRTRLSGGNGSKVRSTVRHLRRCRAYGCFFHCFNATRPVLVRHLKAHLRRAKVKEETLQSAKESNDGTINEKDPRVAPSMASTVSSVASGGDTEDLQSLHSQEPSLIASQTSTADTANAEASLATPPTNDVCEREEAENLQGTEQEVQETPLVPDPEAQEGTATNVEQNLDFEEEMDVEKEAADDGPLDDVEAQSLLDTETEEQATSLATEIESIKGKPENEDQDMDVERQMDDKKEGVRDEEEAADDDLCGEVPMETASDDYDGISAGDCDVPVSHEESTIGSSIINTNESSLTSVDDTSGDTMDSQEVTASAHKSVILDEETNEDSMETSESNISDVLSKENLDSSSPNSPSACTLPSKDIDDLAGQPGDTIEMYHDELQAYFTCYTAKISQTKEFGLHCFSCPKCEASDLRGENLPKHLQFHIGKEINVISVDNINTDFHCVLPSIVADDARPQSLGSPPNPAKMDDSTKIECSVDVGEISTNEENSGEQLTNGYQESEDTISITEDEILKRYFMKDMTHMGSNAVPFGIETLKCRMCTYKTMTILDTPAHIEVHAKKAVVLRK